MGFVVIILIILGSAYVIKINLSEDDEIGFFRISGGSSIPYIIYKICALSVFLAIFGLVISLISAFVFTF